MSPRYKEGDILYIFGSAQGNKTCRVLSIYENEKMYLIEHLDGLAKGMIVSFPFSNIELYTCLKDKNKNHPLTNIFK